MGFQWDVRRFQALGGFPWDFGGPQSSRGISVVPPWDLPGTSLGLQSDHLVTTGLLWEIHRNCDSVGFHGISMVLP